MMIDQTCLTEERTGKRGGILLAAGFTIFWLAGLCFMPERIFAEEEKSRTTDSSVADRKQKNTKDHKQKFKTASEPVGRNQMSQEKLGLKDEEFWTQPFKTKSEIEKRLMKNKVEAMVVGAPEKVLVNARETFPLVALRVAFLKNKAQKEFRNTAIVTATELGSNRVYAAMALRQDVSSPTAAKEFPESWMGGEGYSIDLRERLRLPWKPGEYIVTVLVLDQASERVRTKLVDTSGYEDPEVARFIEENRKKAGMSAVWPEPGDPVPSYKQEKSSPPIPNERIKFKEDEEEAEIDEEEIESGRKRERKPGIALSVARVSVLEDSGQCILSGSFRLPVKEHELQIQDKTLKSATPSALIPINLVLTGTVKIAPTILRLVVPSYEPIDKTMRGPAMVTGYFTIDLCKLAPVTQTPQTFFIYAFSGEVMAGPAPMAFVSKSSLEP